MAKNITNDWRKKIRELIFAKADEFNYISSGRIESGQFIDGLVDDEAIGGVIKDHIKKERVRTYIKDGVLNAYTKKKNKSALSRNTPEDTIRTLFSCDASIIQSCGGKNSGVFALRSEDGSIFVVSSGTLMKWETALRKALELIAREPKLNEGNGCRIALRLSEVGQGLTDADRDHIRSALSIIGIKTLFCGNTQ